ELAAARLLHIERIEVETSFRDGVGDDRLQPVDEFCCHREYPLFRLSVGSCSLATSCRPCRRVAIRSRDTTKSTGHPAHLTRPASLAGWPVVIPEVERGGPGRRAVLRAGLLAAVGTPVASSLLAGCGPGYATAPDP